MRAYGLSDVKDDDKGVLLVFANNAKEAKKMDDGTIDPDYYTDLRVKWYREFDGMENASDRELALAKWKNGWWFDESGYPYHETATDEEFLEWYDSIWGDLY